MAEKKRLAVPVALVAAGAFAPSASPKVLRVLAQANDMLGRVCAGESPVAVTSQGLGDVIHIIGGAG